MRIGCGYDNHALIFGRELVLGGVKIPYEKGLLGHSDADVLIHAVIDAIFGAASLGDIGNAFPDTDEKYKGIDSFELLKIAAQKLFDAGYKIINIDSTIIAQKPKLAPFVDQMRQRLATGLGIEVSEVSVKAKTNEGFDSAGRGECIIAQAVALIELK